MCPLEALLHPWGRVGSGCWFTTPSQVTFLVSVALL